MKLCFISDSRASSKLSSLFGVIAHVSSAFSGSLKKDKGTILAKGQNPGLNLAKGKKEKKRNSGPDSAKGKNYRNNSRLSLYYSHEVSE